MATYTPNNNLKKPDGTDYVLVGDLNGNMDILDGKIGDLSLLNTPSKQSIQAAINEAAEMGGGNPPYFNSTTLTWWQWDQTMAQYEDTGRPASAIVEIGTVTTVAPGNPATVDNSGTDLEVVLDFEIPQGVPGTAATITAGDTTTLAPGQPAAVNQRGTEQAAIFDFDIPRGETGAGLAILGHYDTLSDLQTAHPTGNPGDMYSVGTATPYDMYIWDEPTSAWFDEGPMSGGGGTVQSWNGVSPNEEGDIAVDSGNLPFDSSAQSPISVKEKIEGITPATIGAAPVSHSHGSITNDGKIGSTANLPVFTGTAGALAAVSAQTARAALGAVASVNNTFPDASGNVQIAAGVPVYGTSAEIIGWWVDPAGAGRKPLYGKYFDCGQFALGAWKTVGTGENDIDNMWCDLGLSYMVVISGGSLATTNDSFASQTFATVGLTPDPFNRNAVRIYTNAGVIASNTPKVWAYIRFTRTSDAWQ